MEWQSEQNRSVKEILRSIEAATWTSRVARVVSKRTPRPIVSERRQTATSAGDQLTQAVVLEGLVSVDTTGATSIVSRHITCYVDYTPQGSPTGTWNVELLGKSSVSDGYAVLASASWSSGSTGTLVLTSQAIVQEVAIRVRPQSSQPSGSGYNIKGVVLAWRG